ncbi:hypothetical protein AB0B89_15780 [Sphaerisporangium sp. NPDC049002]|uniref:hypothetical protein n=1 Tax=unclassified Sphaerisporangium TaxID=2630420 RepID=UPI0033D4544F
MIWIAWSSFINGLWLAAADAALAVEIAGIHTDWDGTYGSPRITAELPGNKAVVGVNNDNCTVPVVGRCGSFPGGFDFRVACDMHDYGYGII